jgi:hypothetical protein
MWYLSVVVKAKQTVKDPDDDYCNPTSCSQKNRPLVRMLTSLSLSHLRGKCALIISQLKALQCFLSNLAESFWSKRKASQKRSRRGFFFVTSLVSELGIISLHSYLFFLVFFFFFFFFFFLALKRAKWGYTKRGRFGLQGLCNP